MATISEMIDAVAEHSGLPASRVRSVAHRLRDEGLLPRSANPKAPEHINVRHLATFIVALLADVPLHAVADASRAYMAFRNGTQSAGAAVSDLLVPLANLNPDHASTRAALRTSLTVVDGEKPAVVIRDATAERAYTPANAQWSHEGPHRFSRTMTIGGFGLFRIVNKLGLGIERR